MTLRLDPTVSLRIHLFGSFEVQVNGAPLPRLRSRKVQSLLALLAVRAGTEMERTRLAGLLWPSSPESTALATLRRDLTDLRRALGPAASYLHSPTPRTLRLDLAEAEADVFAFDAAVRRGDVASLEEAVALYQAPLLEGWTAEWVFQERQPREQAYLRALETLAQRAMARGDATASQGYLRRAVAVDPLRETAQRALMQAVAADGNYAAALLVYRELRMLMHRELNAEPDPETQALFEQIRIRARDKAAGVTGPAALQLPSAPQHTANPRTIPTRDLRAYEHYLHSKYYLDHENSDDNEKAIRLLKQAVSRDPTFAKAYVELARAYNCQAYFFGEKQANECAFVAMRRALELEPNLAGAHLAQAHLLWTPDNHFPHELAIREYRRTLALDPDLDEAAEAHHQLAIIYLHIGLFDRALQELQQALEINPGNGLARFRIGVTFHYQGKYQEALAVFDDIPRKAYMPNFEYRVASSLFYLGREGEAASRVQKFLQCHPRDEGGMVTSLEAILFAASGDTLQTEDSIRRAVEKGRSFGHFHHTAYNIASAYSLMSKHEPAIEWLKKAVSDGLPCYPLFERDPNLDNLRRDLRFGSFMVQLRKKWEHYQKL